ncbi:tRNA 2-selenouridine(34) synthase MnmH [Mycoplasmatota bacterium]|nr:tRNA 2-selenouridine(34) synthase MnmH [Mycoplasmatota bacterium]
MDTTDDFKKIVVEENPLIDVRAPIEFSKGAFINSINLPLMTDEERHLVGICYKEKGQEEAIKLGHQLVSNTIRQNRIDAWVTQINQYPNAILYCFRGGQRSRITQSWIKETIGKDIPFIEGGYKAFRNYLMNALNPEEQKSKPILLGGNTGSGKTSLLKQFDNFIDLEGIANHRGSSFGKYITPQPTQINFENNLAYALIQHKHKGFQYMLLEDEGGNVGRCFIPKLLTEYFKKGDLVLLDVPYETRLQNTLNEYVIESQMQYINCFGEEKGLSEWSNYILTSINKIKKRLGGERHKYVMEAFESANQHQMNTDNPNVHSNWLDILLKEYYDPMYEYQIKTTTKDILFKGNTEEVYEYLKTNYNM